MVLALRSLEPGRVAWSPRRPCQVPTKAGVEFEQGIELQSRGMDVTEVAGCVTVPTWVAEAAGVPEARCSINRGSKMQPTGLNRAAQGAVRGRPASKRKEGGGPTAH